MMINRKDYLLAFILVSHITAHIRLFLIFSLYEVEQSFNAGK